MSGMYAGIRALEGGGGRPAIAPEILFALWLYATIEGVSRARALARLTQEHDAYRWICGGVPVNYHTLADIRTAHMQVLDAHLTDSLAAGAVTLKRVAQDGVRIRASAGAASFRRGKTLEACLEESRAQMEHPQGEATRAPRRGVNRPRASARPALSRRSRACRSWPRSRPSKASRPRVPAPRPPTPRPVS